MIMKQVLNITTACFLGLLVMAASCSSTKETATATTETENVDSKPASETEVNEEESNSDKATEGSKANELASIKRTPCYGRCPMYKLTIMDNGEVIYQGKQFVEKLGTYSGLLTSEDLMTILERAKETNYFELEDAYDVPIADFPTCVTSVTKDGKTNRVMNKQGAPPSLKKFELYLDSLIDGLELKKISDEVKY